MDNLFAGKSRNRAASLSEGRGTPTAQMQGQMQGATCPCWGSRLDRRAQHERQVHPSAPATYRSPVITRDHSMIALGTRAGLKANAPTFVAPALRGELASSVLRFAPEEHDKDHAHHGQKWRYQFHPHIPHAPPPLGARGCNNVVFNARSQVGLIRNADQEISVRSGPDRSSP